MIVNFNIFLTRKIGVCINVEKMEKVCKTECTTPLTKCVQCAQNLSGDFFETLQVSGGK